MKTGPKGKSKEHRAKFAKWFYKFEGELPKRIVDIMEISGCTRNEVSSYMYRLRLASRNLINEQPWRHNGPPVLWKDISGKSIPDKAFDVVRASISRFGSMRFTVRLLTKDVHVFKITGQGLKNLYDK